MDNAFPRLEKNWNHSAQDWVYEFTGGLTKRELFAAMAMQGMLAGETEESNYGHIEN